MTASKLISIPVTVIEWLPDETAFVLLRRCKTDQQSTDKWIHLTNETNLAIKNWIYISKIDDGFLLRDIRPSGKITMSLIKSRINAFAKH